MSELDEILRGVQSAPLKTEAEIDGAFQDFMDMTVDELVGKNKEHRLYDLAEVYFLENEKEIASLSVKEMLSYIFFLDQTDMWPYGYSIDENERDVKNLFKMEMIFWFTLLLMNAPKSNHKVQRFLSISTMQCWEYYFKYMPTPKKSSVMETDNISFAFEDFCMAYKDLEDCCKLEPYKESSMGEWCRNIYKRISSRPWYPYEHFEEYRSTMILCYRTIYEFFVHGSALFYNFRESIPNLISAEKEECE